MNNPRKRGRLLLIVIMMIACVAVGFRWFSTSQRFDASTELKQAEHFYENGEYEKSLHSLNQILDDKQDFSPANLLLAEIELAQGHFSTAIEALDRIHDPEDPSWYPAQRLQAEIFHHKLHQLRDAESTYREILSYRPEDVFAHEQYAQLLGLCGRRDEAIPHVLSLIRSGVTTDLLILLARESGSINNLELLESARKADPDDPNPLMGLAYASELQQDASTALSLLRQAESLTGLPDNFHGRLGKQLITLNLHSELHTWKNKLPSRPKSFESWMVLAEMATSAGNPRAAIRSFWEAVRLRPESLKANHQLAQTLINQGQNKYAKYFSDRVQLINNLRDQQQTTILSNETPSLVEIHELLIAYQKAGRLWECYAWAAIALEAAPNDARILNIVSELQPKLQSLPLRLTSPEFNPALELDFSNYPMPESTIASNDPTSHSQQHDYRFEKQADSIGFDFSYFKGSESTTYRMFEFAGGGIAVLDYDRDGFPDLFCTQGRPWDDQDSLISISSDRLFRNQQGLHFSDASKNVGIAHTAGFGQGVAAGDFNNDGFTDLYVAQIGTNQLWLNNGDGTFSDNTTTLEHQPDAWTTSCLIADINGDSYPDLYDVNYLSGENLYERLCRDDHGKTDMCAPVDFASERDRVWMGNGDGTFSDQTEELFIDSPDGKGLGILATRGTKRGLNLFIANDTVANNFYRFPSGDSKSMEDIALVSGLAFSGEGKAEACMGIAAGDCNRDGLLDFYVTNFLYESNTLYTGGEGDIFRDRTHEYGLANPSLPVLGFGTQFLDANLDGQLELFVANGYTHDLSRNSVPYAMAPHFYERIDNRYHQRVISEIISDGELEIVGRAVARLDWNRDGLPDLVVGSLDGPSFLLTNRDAPRKNTFVSLEFASRSSARDAVGTIIKTQIKHETWTHQLTAGDGYQCSNERKIIIGCGPNSHLDQIEIIWPSGVQQLLTDVPTNENYFVVENKELMHLSPSFHSSK